MKESELNNIILQKLNEFEKIENIHPSSEWNHTLMSRIASLNHTSSSLFYSIKKSGIIIIIVLVNLGFVINSMIHYSNYPHHHNTEYVIISEEFLINPISINN